MTLDISGVSSAANGVHFSTRAYRMTPVAPLVHQLDPQKATGEPSERRVRDHREGKTNPICPKKSVKLKKRRHLMEAK